MTEQEKRDYEILWAERIARDSRFATIRDGLTRGQRVIPRVLAPADTPMTFQRPAGKRVRRQPGAPRAVPGKPCCKGVTGAEMEAELIAKEAARLAALEKPAKAVEEEPDELVLAAEAEAEAMKKHPGFVLPPGVTLRPGTVILPMRS